MGITSSYQVNDLSFDEALKKMQSELRDVARRETNSKLRMRDFDGLSAFFTGADHKRVKDTVSSNLQNTIRNDGT